MLQKVIKDINKEIIQELEQIRTKIPYYADTLIVLIVGNCFVFLNIMVGSMRGGSYGSNDDDYDSDPDGGVKHC